MLNKLSLVALWPQMTIYVGAVSCVQDMGGLVKLCTFEMQGTNTSR